MASKQSPGQQQDPASPEEDKSGGTFKTDVSETDEEGTTVREAEVREDDLTEVNGEEEGDSSEEEGQSSEEQGQSSKEQSRGSQDQSQGSKEQGRSSKGHS